MWVPNLTDAELSCTQRGGRERNPWLARMAYILMITQLHVNQYVSEMPLCTVSEFAELLQLWLK